MAHEAYQPVGYAYQADNYCLGCIVLVIRKPGKGNGGNGTSRTGCNCTECRLDRIAKARGIDRYDESSFDSGDFPKAIPYHNDLHAECGPEAYGYGPDDPEWRQPYCDATCAKCHAVIDGTVTFDGTEECPAYNHRKQYFSGV